MAYETLDDRFTSGETGKHDSLSIEMIKTKNSSTNPNETSPLLASTPRVEVRFSLSGYFIRYQVESFEGK